MSRNLLAWVASVVVLLVPGAARATSPAACRLVHGYLPPGGWAEAEQLVEDCRGLGDAAILTEQEVLEGKRFYDQWLRASIYVHWHPEACERWMWLGTCGIRQACLEAWLRGEWEAESFDWERWVEFRGFCLSPTCSERRRGFMTAVRVLLELEGRGVDVGKGWEALGRMWVTEECVETRLQDVPRECRERIAVVLDGPGGAWKSVVSSWWNRELVERRRVDLCRRSVVAYRDMCRAGLAAASMEKEVERVGLPGCSEMRRESWTEERIERWCRRLASGCGDEGSRGAGTRGGGGR